jgi:hypothetical protein
MQAVHRIACIDHEFLTKQADLETRSCGRSGLTPTINRSPCAWVSLPMSNTWTRGMANCFRGLSASRQPPELRRPDVKHCAHWCLRPWGPREPTR